MTPLVAKPPTAPPAPAIDATEAVVTAIAGMQATLSGQITREVGQAVAAHAAASTSAALGTVFAAVAALLAVRLLLMLALLGGFVLAVMALREGTYQADGVMVAYAVLILCPCVWLYARQGPTK